MPLLFRTAAFSFMSAFCRVPMLQIIGNRTLSGLATSDETIRSCSPVNGTGCRCRFLSLLKFLSVGAISQHATQIPYLTISEETVCPSPILARYAASSGATS